MRAVLLGRFILDINYLACKGLFVPYVIFLKPKVNEVWLVLLEVPCVTAGNSRRQAGLASLAITHNIKNIFFNACVDFLASLLEESIF